MKKRLRRRLRLVPVRLIGVGIFIAISGLLFVIAWRAERLEFGFVGVLAAIPLCAQIVTRWLSILASSRPNRALYHWVLWSTAALVLGIGFAAFQLGADEVRTQAALDGLPER